MFELIRSADFSPCRMYRYTLWRHWSQGPCLMVIGLNPSTADETQDDPTIRRCIRFAKDWGFHGLLMTNLFAFRATDPEVMKAHAHPIGTENDYHLKECSRCVRMVLAAWGVHGTHQGRAEQVVKLLGRDIHCLGWTKDGHPRHPLYVRADQKPVIYRSQAIGQLAGREML